MFVYSLRASTLKFFGIIALAVTTLIVLIALIPTFDSSVNETLSEQQQTITYTGIKSAADGAAFLSQFGWEVNSTPIETTEVTIPSEFDTVLSEYNELQKGQGLDLEKYRRRDVTRYTYAVTNFPGYSGTVYANLLVCRTKVIGGDLCTADASGFVQGF